MNPKYKKMTMEDYANRTVANVITEIVQYSDNLLDYAESDLNDTATIGTILIAVSELAVSVQYLKETLTGLYNISRG
jgi:hypothetical protein